MSASSNHRESPVSTPTSSRKSRSTKHTRNSKTRSRERRELNESIADLLSVAASSSELQSTLALSNAPPTATPAESNTTPPTTRRRTTRRTDDDGKASVQLESHTIDIGDRQHTDTSHSKSKKQPAAAVVQPPEQPRAPTTKKLKAESTESFYERVFEPLLHSDAANPIGVSHLRACSKSISRASAIYDQPVLIRVLLRCIDRLADSMTHEIEAGLTLEHSISIDTIDSSIGALCTPLAHAILGLPQDLDDVRNHNRKARTFIPSPVLTHFSVSMRLALVLSRHDAAFIAFGTRISSPDRSTCFSRRISMLDVCEPWCRQR